MVRTTILFAFLASAAAFANPVPTEHNQDAIAIFDSPDVKASAAVIQNIPKKLKCGDASIATDKLVAHSSVTANSRDARYVFFNLNSGISYDLYRVGIDDLRDLTNDRVQEIKAVEVYGFDHDGLFLALEDVSCIKPK